MKVLILGLLLGLLLSPLGVIILGLFLGLPLTLLESLFSFVLQ